MRTRMRQLVKHFFAFPSCSFLSLSLALLSFLPSCSSYSRYAELSKRSPTFSEVQQGEKTQQLFVTTGRDRARTNAPVTGSMTSVNANSSPIDYPRREENDYYSGAEWSSAILFSLSSQTSGEYSAVCCDCSRGREPGVVGINHNHALLVRVERAVQHDDDESRRRAKEREGGRLRTISRLYL